jgi:tetratricopeptide (TPR) repeat protein
MLKTIVVALSIVGASVVGGFALVDSQTNIRACADSFDHAEPEDGSSLNRIASDFFNRGKEYQSKGDLGCAIVAFDNAIRFGIAPYYPEVHYRRGNMYRSRGENDPTLAELDNAIVGNPDHADAYYNRGNADYAIDDLARARTMP